MFPREPTEPIVVQTAVPCVETSALLEVTVYTRIYQTAVVLERSPHSSGAV